MKDTTRRMVKESRECRESFAHPSIRKVFADLHRENRARYRQCGDYARARAKYLVSVNY